MTTTSYTSRLRFVDAGKLDEADTRLDSLRVYGWGREELGHLDGFVVDGAADNPLYAVIRGGGWFNSKGFLLPIGHIDRVDLETQEMMTDISKDAVRRLPEFDRNRFLEMSDEEMRAFERQTAAACCPSVAIVDKVAWVHETLSHYDEPSWWRAEYSESASSAAVGTTGRSGPGKGVRKKSRG